MRNKITQYSLRVIPVLLLSSRVLAEETADLADIASNVGKQAYAIAQLLSVSSYITGVGFAMAGILQFKTHKDNPQQVPLSKAVVMILVASCLLFLPSILNVLGNSLWGFNATSSAKAGGIRDLSGY